MRPARRSADGRVVAQGTVAELRARGPERLRLVTDRDAGWVRDIAGLKVVEVDGPEALVEVTDLDEQPPTLSAAPS